MPRQARLDAAREKQQEEARAAAIQHIADIPGVTQEETGDTPIYPTRCNTLLSGSMAVTNCR